MKQALLEKLRVFYGSYLYLIMVAAIAIISFATPFAYVGIIIITLITALSFVVTNDCKPYMAGFLYGVYALNDKVLTQQVNVLFFAAVALVPVLLAAMIYRLVVIIKAKSYTFGKIGIGLIILVVTMSLGGIIGKFDILAMLAILAIGAFCFFLYFLFVNTANKNIKKYVAHAIMLVGVIAFMELVIYYISFGDFWHIVNHKVIDMGWGVSNNVGMLFVMALPATMYLATHKKYAVQYTLLAMIFYVGLLFTFSRGNILFCTLLLPVMCVFALLKAESRRKILITLLAVLAVFAGLVLLFFPFFVQVFEGMINKGFESNERVHIYVIAIERFLSSPIFGGGFAPPQEYISSMPAYFMTHCTVLQQLGCCGIIGLLGISPYYFGLYRGMFKNMTVFKLFALFSLLLFDLYGLMDLNFNTVYLLFAVYCLAVAAEKEEEGRYIFTRYTYTHKISQAA